MAGPVRIRRTLKLMSADGIAYSVMVGAGESYLPAFALALGLSDVEAGLVATLPMVAGGVLQLLSPRGIAMVGGYRAWVVVCAAVQALSFAPLIGAALSRTIPAEIVFASAALYWAAGMATSPAWNAWVGKLVPAEVRGRYFGVRQSLMQIGVLAGLVGAGLCLDGWQGDQTTAFALIFAGAGLARMVSAGLLAAHPDVPADPPLGAVDTLRLAFDSSQGRWMLLVVAMHGAANLAGPFFTPFLLTEVRLSYTEYMVLVGAVFVAKTIALPTLGRLTAGGSALRMMALSGVGIALGPLLWTVSDHLAYLLAVQVIMGVSWAAFELAAQLGFLAVARAGERAALLYAFNALNAGAVAAAAAIGGLLLFSLGADRDAYLVVFAVSCGARLLIAAILGARLRGAHLPLRAIPVRVLGLLPWSGPILRPVLAVLRRGRDQPDEARADEREPRPRPSTGQ